MQARTRAWPVMQRIGMESAEALYKPVTMSVPAGPEVPMHTDVARVGAGVALGHVRGTFDVASEDVIDATDFLQGRVQRIDGSPGMPNAVSTPSRRMTRTAASIALILLMVCASLIL